jgi:hypothetical protein
MARWAGALRRRRGKAVKQHGRGPFLVCPDLRDSIDEAVESGALSIVDELSC